MALIKCPECGEEISSKSKVCVHCGFPFDEHNTEATTNKIHSVENYQKTEKSDIVSSNVASIQKNTAPKYLITVFAVVAVLIIILIVSFLNKNEFIDGISLGMPINAVAKAENNNGTEYKDSYLVQDKDFNNEICDFAYKFDENDKLHTIVIMPHSSNYKVFSNIFNQFYALYGTPVSMIEDYESTLPMQKIVWQLKKGTVSLVYNGYSTHTDNGTVVVYTKNTKEGVTPTEIHLHGKQICTAGAKVGGCKNEATAWSEYCINHSCNIVGCDHYLFSREINHIPLCARHFKMVLDGVIYVGHVDNEIKEEYS